MLLKIAAYAPVITPAKDPVGLALARVQTAAVGLCLYSTLAELARAAAAYNFSSYNQAAAVSSLVAAALSAERYPDQPTQMDIQPGNPVIVKIGSDIVLTGWIDRVLPSIDTHGHHITIIGRGRCCDRV